MRCFGYWNGKLSISIYSSTIWFFVRVRKKEILCLNKRRNKGKVRKEGKKNKQYLNTSRHLWVFVRVLCCILLSKDVHVLSWFGLDQINYMIRSNLIGLSWLKINILNHVCLVFEERRSMISILEEASNLPRVFASMSCSKGMSDANIHIPILIKMVFDILNQSNILVQFESLSLENINTLD